MPSMTQSEHLDVDDYLLRLLLAVFEEGSITRAVLRLAYPVGGKTLAMSQ